MFRKILVVARARATSDILLVALVVVALVVALRFWIWCATMRTGALVRLSESLASMGWCVILRYRAFRCRLAWMRLEIRCSIRLSYAPSVISPPLRAGIAWKPVLGGMRSGLSTVILPHGGRRTGRAGSAVGFYGCDDRLRVTADRQKGNHGTRDCWALRASRFSRCERLAHP
jgi:hypothetical protein